MSLARKFGAACVWALVVASAQAQDVTRFVTGSSPGSGVDTVARLLAEPMAGLLDRTVIVENKPGAAYNIAAGFVARAAADGRTVLVTFNVHPIAKALNPTIAFDPVRDFRAVGMVAATPYVVAANPSLPGTSLKETIALAKTQGRALNFGSLGIGTPQHLMIERLRTQTGADIRIVHYKSATQAMTDVMAGHLDFSLLTVSTAEAQIKANKLKPLAVTSDRRLAAFPEAPTIGESGYRDFISNGWYAMFLPARTPDAVVQAYNDALNKALALPSVRDRLSAIGASATPGTPQDLDRRVREDEAMWRKVIVDNRIRPE